MSSAVVVGVGPGLGSALARRFASEGHDLTLLNRDITPLAELQRALQAGGRRVTLHALDVTDESAVTAAITGVAADLGPVAVLVYNAISFTADPPSRVRPEDLRRDMDVALGGLATAVRAALPSLTASALTGAPTSILITGGGAALFPQSTQGTLPMTKAAQRAYTYALADELAETNINVTTVTIMGAIGSSEDFSPDAIAESFWRAHTDPPATGSPEITYTGAP